jgi:hypothetical protein
MKYMIQKEYKIFLIVLIALLSSCTNSNKPQVQIRPEEYEVYNSILQEFAPSEEDTVFTRYADDAIKHHRTIIDHRIHVLPIYNTTVLPPPDTDRWDTTELSLQRPKIGNNQFRKQDKPQNPLNRYTSNVFSYFAQILPHNYIESLKSDFYHQDTVVQSLDSNQLRARLPIYLLSKIEYRAIISGDTTSQYFRVQIADQMKYHHWQIKFSRVGFDKPKHYAIVYYYLGQPGGGSSEIRLLEKRGANWITIRKARQYFI